MRHNPSIRYSCLQLEVTEKVEDCKAQSVHVVPCRFWGIELRLERIQKRMELALVIVWHIKRRSTVQSANIMQSLGSMISPAPLGMGDGVGIGASERPATRTACVSVHVSRPCVGPAYR